MDLFAMQVAENHHSLRTTLLCRRHGEWHRSEIDALAIGLTTEVVQKPGYPEYLILFKHFTKEETLKALGGGQSYIVNQIVGIKGLPFDPGFI